MTNKNIHYSWAVVLACFFCCFSYGIFYTFSVFFKHLQMEFGWSRGLTSTIHSLHWIFFPISSLVIGWFTDRYGPKLPLICGASLLGLGTSLLSCVQSPIQFYLFYAIASMGSGIVWSLPTATVQRWFEKRRGVALGIVASGIGFGYALSPLSSFIIVNFGWRTAYLLLGTGIWLILAFASCIIAGSPEEKGLKPYGVEEDDPRSAGEMLEGWEAKEAVKTPIFWQICAMHVTHLFAVMIIAVHLVNFATDIGIKEVHAATAWFLVGVFSMPGRIFGGYIGERIGYRKGFILCGSANALALLWLLCVKDSWMLFAFVPFYGFFYGGQTPMMPGLFSRFFGLKPLSTLVGLQLFTGMIGGTTAPLFAGFIFDTFANYNIAFITASLFWAMSALLAFLLERPVK
ncbi:MAG: MFS transporter [Thermodesulfobacteriota bacterium]|nr:MFS transporter [Thermodesulfobacteriota bacterium]